MPKIVNHRERRSAVMSLTEAVIVEDGLAAVSFKGIADAAGSSTAIVSHYFESKQDLLHQTYQAVLGRSRDEQKDAVSSDDATILTLADRLLPLRPEMVGAWRISVEFFSAALSDPAIREEWERNLDDCVANFQMLFDRMMRADQLPRHVDTALAAQDMVALIRGIGTEFAVSGDRWPPERQRASVARLLAGIVRG